MFSLNGWRRYRALPGPRRRFVREALVQLLWARIALACVPFRHLAAWMGAPGTESPRDLHPEQEQTVEAVSWALRAAALRVPWDCRCLAQAIAGHRMLRRHGLRSTVYFGVRKDPDSPFDAHAWLRCGSWLVTGGEGHQKYRVLCRFPHRDTA